MGGYVDGPFGEYAGPLPFGENASGLLGGYASGTFGEYDGGLLVNSLKVLLMNMMEVLLVNSLKVLLMNMMEALLVTMILMFPKINATFTKSYSLSNMIFGLLNNGLKITHSLRHTIFEFIMDYGLKSTH